MSRSRRTTPIHGVAGGSEASDKAEWHKAARQRTKRAIEAGEFDALHATDHREVSDPWLMKKDGKGYNPDLPESLMRK